MKRLVCAVVLALATVIGLTAAPAQAATGWTTLRGWPNGSVFLACQYSEYGGPYGPVWQVRLVLAHNPNEPVVHLRGTFVIQRMGADGRYHAIASTPLATDSVGQWDVRYATGSQIGGTYNGGWYADRWSWGAGDERGGLGDTSPQSFWQLGHC